MFEWRHSLSLIILIEMFVTLIETRLCLQIITVVYGIFFFFFYIYALIFSSYCYAANRQDVNLRPYHVGVSFSSAPRRLWGKKKKAVAQAVTSWNEWLTYKGVSLHVSAQRDAARQKYTREPSATG